VSDDPIADDLRVSLPDFAAATIELAGQGDYCRAYSVDREWIFLVARHAEGARSLAQAAALLPVLAPTLPLAVPVVAYSGRTNVGGHAFVGYRQVRGVELTAERFRALSARDQGRCAADLARFLRQMHGFPVEVARGLGIVECAYPFAATEDGLSAGTVAAQYRRDLDRLLRFGVLDQATRNFCERIVAEHLAARPAPLVLLHGEVSGDHVLYDPATGQLTGVIDFNGVIIGDPVRDFLYLYEEYGLPFMAHLLEHYPVADRRELLTRLHFFREWHTALRLLWALEHHYERGIAVRLVELGELRQQVAAPPWLAIV
jgi:aminoglycoside 2''-phosphotransferase